jgi:crotonobetainyl-CoA:carnitine CoA-transferase CaiB-like acyl-CoA transferase
MIAETVIDTTALLSDLLASLGLKEPPPGEVTISGHDPIWGTKYPVGEAAAVLLAAIGVAVNDLWELRTGRRQQIHVDVRKAAASLRGHWFQLLNGQETPREDDLHLIYSDRYQCRDGRWIQLHGGFPHLGVGTSKVIGSEHNRESIAAAVAQWDSFALEEALAAAGMCGVICRTGEEWRETEQGKALLKVPPVLVEKIGDSPPKPIPPGDRPLAGLKVLDLTRVLAGPASARTLAEHGAEVLHITSPNLPSVPPYVLATNPGKLSAYLDLNSPDDADQLLGLASDADLFVQGYRAGALERRGFGVDELTKRHPGLIYVSVNCYGPVGPWRDRPGWEQLGQSATGLAIGHSNAEHPTLLPAQMCDYGTGYFTALGALIALGRRAREGGSYRVHASLCQTGMWVERLGTRCNPEDAVGLGDMSDLYTHYDSPVGRLSQFAPALELSETPPHWARPAVPLGTHPPAWASTGTPT